MPDMGGDDLLAAWQTRNTGSSLRSPKVQLSTLATSVKLDSFEKVKEMMDTMVAELKKEQAEEVKFKEYCGTELKENEKTTYKKNEKKKDLEDNIAQLDTLMTKLASEIKDAEKQMEETQQA